MASMGEVFKVGLEEIIDFVKRHRILVASSVAVGVGVWALRRHLAGGVCRSHTRLDGKTVVITGGNTGIGRETARELARRGARIILACRDVTKGERAAADIRQDTDNSQVLVQVVDLGSLQSVRKLAQRLNDTEKQINILINNAGVMATPYWKSEDGYEQQFAVNHLGHFLLTSQLLDLLKKSAPSRIINLTSLAYQWGTINLDDINLERNYSEFGAYGQSKLANILFTRELHNRLQDKGVTSYAVHPGVVKTELGRHTSLFQPLWEQWMWKFLSFTVLKSSLQGAQTTLHCALEEGLEKHSGRYFSDCAPRTLTSAAQDDAMAKKLWELSEKMVAPKS